MVAGICNPRGERNEYNGLYLTAQELQNLVPSIRGTPVKAEHTGESLGRVVSGYVSDDGALNCVIRIDDSLEGEIAKGLVRDGIASDFSLGYSVQVQHRADRLLAGDKSLLEISIVRRGAREGCRILAFCGDSDDSVFLRRDPWFAFDLR